jgi:non-canonical (house-cleaning) NTP pyrophosphatase
MKKIALGSTSQDKRRILAECLKAIGENEYIITPHEASSGIAEQPLDEETTITGAMNRAHRAQKIEPIRDYGVGLEAGLVEIENLGYSLVCVCALVERNGAVYLGISDKTPLSKEVSETVKAGDSFGKSIRKYRETCDDEEKELTDRLISREQEFSDAIERAFSLDVSF